MSSPTSLSMTEQSGVCLGTMITCPEADTPFLYKSEFLGTLMRENNEHVVGAFNIKKMPKPFLVVNKRVLFTPLDIPRQCVQISAGPYHIICSRNHLILATNDNGKTIRWYPASNITTNHRLAVPGVQSMIDITPKHRIMAVPKGICQFPNLPPSRSDKSRQICQLGMRSAQINTLKFLTKLVPFLSTPLDPPAVTRQWLQLLNANRLLPLIHQEGGGGRVLALFRLLGACMGRCYIVAMSRKPPFIPMFGLLVGRKKVLRMIEAAIYTVDVGPPAVLGDVSVGDERFHVLALPSYLGILLVAMGLTTILPCQIASPPYDTVSGTQCARTIPDTSEVLPDMITQRIRSVSGQTGAGVGAGIGIGIDIGTANNTNTKTERCVRRDTQIARSISELVSSGRHPNLTVGAVDIPQYLITRTHVVYKAAFVSGLVSMQPVASVNLYNKPWRRSMRSSGSVDTDTQSMDQSYDGGYVSPGLGDDQPRGEMGEVPSEQPRIVKRHLVPTKRAKQTALSPVAESPTFPSFETVSGGCSSAPGRSFFLDTQQEDDAACEMEVCPSLPASVGSASLPDPRATDCNSVNPVNPVNPVGQGGLGGLSGLAGSSGLPMIDEVPLNTVRRSGRFSPLSYRQRDSVHNSSSGSSCSYHSRSSRVSYMAPPRRQWLTSFVMRPNTKATVNRIGLLFFRLGVSIEIEECFLDTDTDTSTDTITEEQQSSTPTQTQTQTQTRPNLLLKLSIKDALSLHFFLTRVGMCFSPGLGRVIPAVLLANDVGVILSSHTAQLRPFALWTQMLDKVKRFILKKEGRRAGSSLSPFPPTADTRLCVGSASDASHPALWANGEGLQILFLQHNFEKATFQISPTARCVLGSLLFHYVAQLATPLGFAPAPASPGAKAGGSAASVASSSSSSAAVAACLSSSNSSAGPGSPPLSPLSSPRPSSADAKGAEGDSGFRAAFGIRPIGSQCSVSISKPLRTRRVDVVNGLKIYSKPVTRDVVACITAPPVTGVDALLLSQRSFHPILLGQVDPLCLERQDSKSAYSLENPYVSFIPVSTVFPAGERYVAAFRLLDSDPCDIIPGILCNGLVSRCLV